MTERSGVGGIGPPIRLFAYTPSRSKQASLHLYAGAHEGGVLMTDGYAPYNQVARTNKLVYLACWAHCRRYFNDAVQALLPKGKRGLAQPAVQFMELIGKLYHVESAGRMKDLDSSALMLRRHERCIPVL